MAGAYAEHLPVFHLVGMPNMATQYARAPMHHTFGNGEYDLFRRMSEPVVCAHAVMTPQNVAYETERLIAEALYHRRPVYMAFPSDLANLPVLGEAEPIPAPRSDPESLAAATAAIEAAIAGASSACLVGGILVARAGLRDAFQALVDASGLPFSTMMMGKSVLDEQDPAYIGMYSGALMNEPVRNFVETCDRVLLVGAPLTDLDSGAFTARLDPARIVTVAHHHVSIGGRTYANVEMGELLALLAKQLPSRDWPKLAARPIGDGVEADGDDISAAALYSRWERFLKPDDIVVVETGTVSMGISFALLPKGATFHNQTLWGSIGWATPAAFGAAIAAPERHVVLITGEGAHQLIVQEIGQFGRHGLKPTIFVLNNDGYLIERLLCKDPEASYNEVAPWRYADLPKAFGNDGWLTARVSTCAEFDDAMLAASRADSAAYIEVVTGAYAASPFAEKLHEAVKTLYKG